jgi:hypothetical protein
MREFPSLSALQKDLERFFLARWVFLTVHSYGEKVKEMHGVFWEFGILLN